MSRVKSLTSSTQQALSQSNVAALGAQAPLMPLLRYLSVVFFVALADALMAYSSPVLIESALGGPALLGIVLAVSSVFGLLADFLIGKWFGNKPFSFFLFWTIMLALVFPLTLLLFPPIVPIFIVAMAAWGIYYELLEFSNFHFIHKHQPSEKHAWSWSVIYLVKSASYALGAFSAGYLLHVSTKIPLMGAIVSCLLALSLLLLLFKKKPTHLIAETPKKRSVFAELAVWQLIGKRIFPVWLATFSLLFVDALFWSIGPVMAEEFSGKNGGLLLSAYMLGAIPAMVVGNRFGHRLGKKRSAFIAAIFAGLFLMAMGLRHDFYFIIAMAFCAATFTAIALPKILGAAEDYMDRLKSFGSEMVGLERSAYSMAYVLGPISAGLISSVSSYQQTFVILGAGLILVSIVLLIITPRKIRMPQVELHKELVVEAVRNEVEKSAI